MNIFANSNSWINYKSIVKEQFGISLDSDPIESFINIRNHSVRVDEWSTQSTQKGTVILVHGGGGNGRILAPFAQPLAANGWRVLAPDLPGYGRTVPVRGYRGDYQEWLEVIAELADKQSENVALIGYSMGGLTALLASQKSKKVRAVIATTLLNLSDPEIFVLAARAKWLGRLSLLGIKLFPGLLDRIYLPLALATPLKSMSSNREMQNYFIRDELLGASWKSVAFFRSVHQHKIANLNMSCPLLLVHPGSDMWTPTALSLKVFNEIITDKRFIELSNGSHLPLEEPAYSELNSAVLEFLDDKVFSLHV